MNGLDTRGGKNLEIVFGCTPNNPYPRDQTMYVFCRANVITVYTK